jgi:hypothetical protein
MTKVHLLPLLLFPVAILCDATDLPKYPTIEESLRGAYAAAKQYASSVSCLEEFDLKNVIQLGQKRPVAIDGDNWAYLTYAAIWRGDLACAGGSGSSGNHIAIIKVGASKRHYYVDVAHSTPMVEFDVFPSRYYPRIVGIGSDSSITLSGLDDDPEINTGLCCPSVPVKVTVRSDKNGNWRVLNKIVVKDKVKRKQ